MAVSDRSASPTEINLVGRHDGGAGLVTTFCQQGDATTPPAPYPSGFALQFPSPQALSIRARAWVNTLASTLVVTLFKNGAPALRSDGSVVQFSISAGSTFQIFNTTDVIEYGPNDTYDVSLTSAAAGPGNVALVGVAIDAVPDGRRYAAPTINMTARLDGDAVPTSTFCEQGDVTTPAQPNAQKDFPFPAGSMAYMRARAWFNNLASNGILVRPLVNGVPASSQQPLTITNATNATPVVVTTFENHRLASGNLIRIEGTKGAPAIDGEWFIFIPPGPSDGKTFQLQGSNGTITVTDASNASPIVITTSAPHNLVDGQTVTVSGVLGNTNANGTFTIMILSPTTFQLVGTTGNAAYAGGGTVTNTFLPGGIVLPQIALFIPSGSTEQFINDKEVAIYNEEGAAYDVRLETDGVGGAGNFALVAVSFNTYN